MTGSRPKKTDPFGVRFGSQEQREQFEMACKESGIAPADALRMAAEAMINAHQKFGRIPRDMEIRQVQLGDLSGARAFNQFSSDIQALLIEQAGKGLTFAQVVGAAGATTVEELADLRAAYAFLVSNPATTSGKVYPERSGDLDLAAAEPPAAAPGAHKKPGARKRGGHGSASSVSDVG